MNNLEETKREEQDVKKRIAGLDIVRVTAIFCVIAGHFFLNTPFMQTPFAGVSMFIQAVFRNIFEIGVPLFLMLTGYLNINKVVCKKYYRGMVRVLVAYLLYSVITILFRKYYIHEDLTAVAWVRKILDFSAINYGWYIEMWIGLFLLTPFLNILYKHIPDKRTKQVLIATLFLMTAVPSLTNRYEQHIFPDWWQTIWPLLFFFIGCYIREYRSIVSTAKGLAIIFGISLFNPLFNVLLVENHSLIQITGGVDGAFGVIIAVIVFLLLYQRDVSNATTKKILVKVSFLSLDMYLLSYMFDMLVYPLLKDRYFVSQGQFGIWFFVAVPAVFLLTLAVSFLFSPIIKKLS